MIIGKKFERADASVYVICCDPEDGTILGAAWEGEDIPFIRDAEVAGAPVPEHETFRVGMRPLLGSDSRAISDLMIVQGRKGGARTKIGSVIREKIIRSVVYIEGPLTDAQGRPVERITADNFGLFRADFLNAISKASAELNHDLEEGDGELGE